MVKKPSEAFDVVVIGAGAAGLTAAAELGRAGLSVRILEARERIGGRILTLRDPSITVPIEMGAEFIHGFPPQIWTPLLDAKTKISEVAGQAWCYDAHLRPCDFADDVDQILKLMDDKVPDQSFGSFLSIAVINQEMRENKKQKNGHWLMLRASTRRIPNGLAFIGSSKGCEKRR